MSFIIYTTMEALKLFEFKDNLYSSPMSDARASAHANRPDTRMGEDGPSHCSEHTQCFIRNPE